MKKYAQIIKKKVHHILDCKKLPPFHPSIEMVEITGLDPMPQEGWLYDGEIFSPSDGKAAVKRDLAKLDREGSFNRVAEDLIDLLISKGTITLAELPSEAQEKINKRKALRVILG